MLLTSIRVEGLRSAPEVHVEPAGALHRLPAGPEGAAVADGLALLAASLGPAGDAPGRPGAFGPTVGRLDLATPETSALYDGPLLDEVEQLDPDGVAALAAPAAHRHVTVAVDVRPDPPMFGRLRELAGREPRLLGALASGATLHLRVGWLFNRAGTHASVGVLAFRVGDERFPTAGADRPAWLPPLLEEFGTRLHRLDPLRDEGALATALHRAALSPVPELRTAVDRALDALAGPPFELGRLHLVQTRPGRFRLGVGDRITPLRAWGPHALDAVRLVHAALVVRPDVLILDHPGPAPWLDWLAARTEGDEATLEQVLVVAPPWEHP